MPRVIFALALLFVSGLFVSPEATAASPVAPGTGVTFYQDMSSTNVPSTYGSGSQLVTGLTNSQSFEICTTQAVPLAGCSYSSAANCSACTANFVVPGNGCVSFGPGEIRIGPKLCVKGLPPATAVSTGSVYGAVR